MSMTTAIYGIVITTIAFITILHFSNASNNNNNMKIHIIRPRNDSLIWGKYLDISIGITHPSPSMLSNLNATICVEINPNEIYNIDSFDKVLLLEENRKLRKEINKLRMEIEECK